MKKREKIPKKNKKSFQKFVIFLHVFLSILFN
jgi:hypothetical protein